MPDKTSLFKKILKLPVFLENFALDMLFPVFCQFCHKEGTWLCQECLDRINILSFQVCPYCEQEITEEGQICTKCKNNHYGESKRINLSSLILSCEYKDISSLIHLFKYRFVEDIGSYLGKIILKSLIKNNATIPDIIIPIPLHRRRLRWRGFNQSEVLSKIISENLSPGFAISMRTDILIRKKYTPPQMKIKNYKERIENLKNAFEIEEGKVKDIKNKEILLVDDVITTGSTIFECAKILMENGAKKVSATAISRQKME